MVDSGLVALIVSVLSILTAFTALLFAVLELKEMRKTTKLQAFLQVREWLQDEDQRSYRRRVFRLEGVPFDQWKPEDWDVAEQVAHTYDAVGQLVADKMLPEQVVLRTWGHSIHNTYEIITPLIEHRHATDTPGIWGFYRSLRDKARATVTA